MAPDHFPHAYGALRPGGTAEKRPENYGYGLPTMPGGQDPGGRGLQTPNDGRGVELLGEPMGTGTISGVREGFSKGFTGCTHPNPAWRGNRADGGKG